jgi:serine/threonine-protein kinase RsbT
MALPSSDTYAALLDLLGKYMSPILARSVLKRAAERAGTTERTLSQRDLPHVLKYIESGTQLFVDPTRAAALTVDLRGLLSTPELPQDVQIPVRSERDISEARVRAWQLAERLGARRYTLQRVSTVVSELARNIASYTPGGSIELAVIRSRDTRLRVTARDEGSGISNLDEIMSGQYRSRTGLGVGIVATKRLSDAFEIRTGPTGTFIQVEVIR